MVDINVKSQNPNFDRQALDNLRRDSLKNHDGASRKYGSLTVDTCKQVIINRKFDSSEVQIVFEESDGYGHGINVPPGWLTEDHVPLDRVACPRCAGSGKLKLGGIDCSECLGTGKLVLMT